MIVPHEGHTATLKYFKPRLLRSEQAAFFLIEVNDAQILGGAGVLE